jgi:hypothetical protein
MNVEDEMDFYDNDDDEDFKKEIMNEYGDENYLNLLN